MSKRNVTHNTFTIERVYPASPARVFNAWAQPDIKPRWFAAHEEWGPDEHALDFRVGGRETSRGGPKGGPVHLYEALYHDIVPNQRIIYSYDLYLDTTRISVSLTTVELVAAGAGTRLIFTEQGVFLDGHEDPAERAHGTGILLDMLGAELQRQSSTVG